MSARRSGRSTANSPRRPFGHPFFEAMRLWAAAYIRPDRVFAELVRAEAKLALGFWINLVFAFLYSITPLVCYLTGVLPVIEPWIPIAADRYYLYQIFWTIPWGLATWIMLGGTAQAIASIGGTRGSFEDALNVMAVGWAVPWLICGWLPETVVFPIFGITPAGWLEVIRYAVVPEIWQAALVTAGLVKTHGLHPLAAFVIALVTVGLFFVMFLAFMR